MDDHRHHRLAPITEAVLDIRVELAEDSLPRLAKIGSKVRDLYPTRNDRMQFEGQWTVGPDVAVAGSQKQLGYQFTSSNQLQVLQTRSDGFTFSRFRPYTDWEHFCGESRRLWAIYRSLAKVETITRIAVRYINRLELPIEGPLLDFKDYLRTLPEVSPDLPQSLSAYFMQVQIPIEEIHGTVVINQGLIEPSEPNVIPLLLDIDLSRSWEIPQDDDALWVAFDQLRVAKNRIFEGCITEKTRRLID